MCIRGSEQGRPRAAPQIRPIARYRHVLPPHSAPRTRPFLEALTRDLIEPQTDAFIFHDQLLHVCCASATFRDFVLRVPEVVEAVSAADVKASESVVWHALLSLIAEEEPTAARYYEASCAYQSCSMRASSSYRC